MNSKQIKKLITEFNNIHQDFDYVEHRFYNDKNLSKDEKENLETEIDSCEQELYHISDTIKKLKPSKYMINKYSELEYILDFI